MARIIPDGAVEIQTGLWLYTENPVVNGVTLNMRHLYSSDGYCFYDLEDGEEGRIYYQYMMIGNPNKSLDDIVSIPISELPEGAEIAGNPNKPEIA